MPLESGAEATTFRRNQKDTNRILVEDGHLIDKALEEGVRKAMLQHKKDSLPVVIERDGKIEWVKPEDLGY